MGSITGGDMAHAKDDAVEDALRNAIEQTLGTMIQSETLAQNFTVIEDNIYSKTQGYIQKYDILQQGKRDAQVYAVTVKALVKVSQLKDDLDAISTLMRRKKMPRLMVMIDEKNIGETATAYHYLEADLNTAESELMNKFMDKGFRFVDTATVKQNLNREKEAAILEGDVMQAADGRAQGRGRSRPGRQGARQGHGSRGVQHQNPLATGHGHGAGHTHRNGRYHRHGYGTGQVHPHRRRGGRDQGHPKGQRPACRRAHDQDSRPLVHRREHGRHPDA